MLKLFGDPADSVEDYFCAYDGDDDSFAAYSNPPFQTSTIRTILQQYFSISWVQFDKPTTPTETIHSYSYGNV